MTSLREALYSMAADIGDTAEIGAHLNRNYRKMGFMERLGDQISGGEKTAMEKREQEEADHLESAAYANIWAARAKLDATGSPELKAEVKKAFWEIQKKCKTDRERISAFAGYLRGLGDSI